MKKTIVLALILVVPAIIFYVNNANYSLKNLADVYLTDLDKVEPYSAYRFIKKDSLRVDQKKKNLDPKWEYIKNTLFDHDFENRRAYFPDKLRGPILLVLKNATQQDSLAFKSVMEELRLLIPQKPVAYFSDFIGENYETFVDETDYNKKIKNYSRKEITTSTLKISINEPIKVKIATALQMKGENTDRFFDTYRNFRWVDQNQWTSLDFVFDENISFDKRNKLIVFGL